MVSGKKADIHIKIKDKPVIYTYFKDAPINVTKLSSQELQTREAFWKHLTEIQHFPTFFTSSKDLIIKFGSQLDKYFAQKNIL